MSDTRSDNEALTFTLTILAGEEEKLYSKNKRHWIPF